MTLNSPDHIRGDLGGNDKQSQLAAVARRAFGGTPDVRPLLPEYEEEIGRMMAAEVPKPKHQELGMSHAFKLKEQRRAELLGVRDMLVRGMTARQIAEAKGWSWATSRRRCREAKGMTP